MNVLLISPKDPKKPGNLKFLMGGENTYTNTLLKYPPDGIEYTHHADALRRGEIAYTLWQPILTWMIKLRILPLDAGYHCIKLKKRFDLIHCHAYCLKLDGSIKPPVVLGDSSSNYLFLRDYVNWHPFRIKVQYAIRKLLHKSLGIYDKDLTIYTAKSVIVFSQFAKRIHRQLGIPGHRIEVVPPGLRVPDIKHREHSKTITILFAGVWFERKGGLQVLQAFKSIHKKYPHTRLVLLGPIPKGLIPEGLPIEQHDYIPYSKLTGKYYREADIFVLVPPKAEGYGLVVPEALSYGIPVIVSDVYALPEHIEHGKSGIIIPAGNVTRLIAALDLLISDRVKRRKMKQAAKQRFLSQFAVELTNKKLSKIYNQAVSGKEDVLL